MYSELLIFDILFFLMPIFALAALFLAAKSKKRPALVLAVAFFVFELVKIALWIAGIEISPAFTIVLQTAPELAFVLGVLVTLRSDPRAVLISAAALLPVCAAEVTLILLSLITATRTVEVDGKKYTGMYSKFSGIGPTVIEYHKNHSPLLVERAVSFTDDYGVIFTDITDEVLDESEFSRTFKD
ncbi:MAG: hypothetical protein IJV00_07520 [Clostridia bacterium]|nr:hypothetical protein [Clostridia bacterium]